MQSIELPDKLNIQVRAPFLLLGAQLLLGYYVIFRTLTHILSLNCNSPRARNELQCTIRIFQVVQVVVDISWLIILDLSGFLEYFSIFDIQSHVSAETLNASGNREEIVATKDSTPLVRPYFAVRLPIV
jgi:hypothetical protein